MSVDKEKKKSRMILYKAPVEPGAAIHPFDAAFLGDFMVQVRLLPKIERAEEKHFDENFRDCDPSTRVDATIQYAEFLPWIAGSSSPLPPHIDKDGTKHVKIDVIAFFTKDGEKGREFRIYQMGRRYVAVGTDTSS